MRVQLLFIITVVLSVGMYAQQHSYDYIVNQYCMEVQRIDFDSLSRDEIFLTNIEIGKKIRNDNADTIEYIVSNIQAKNDSLTQLESIAIFSKHYLYDIIYNCNTYLKINRISMDNCPQETKSMQYIVIRVNDYLAHHPNFTYKEVLDSAGYMGFVYGKDIPDQLMDDYDFEFVYPDILIKYLLHKSDIFLRAWLYNQSLKLF